ncbi:MAG: hypothetical protein F6K24_10905 [Okeania sp. SIO2D1]|nr:hypothetical protein [Okeania sp. SIO2D1]
MGLRDPYYFDPTFRTTKCSNRRRRQETAILETGDRILEENHSCRD